MKTTTSKQKTTQAPTLDLQNIHIEGDLITMTAADWQNLNRWREEMCVGPLISLIDILSATAPLPPAADTLVTRKFDICHLRRKPKLVQF